MKYKIGQKVRVGGIKGTIETIIGYDEKTDTYTLLSENCIGYLCPSDATFIPIKDYEQLKLF